ncbi:OLC1v1016063C2 [Oldenlandia corymbosa var. corymbosa]|uniref:OLC1v1016063C2 n=1 Tax=Oldenlandia corymbosa var. corymbosa TaxID=529605 RepID=A0AAV1E4V7_OLDCO|nr:OLC1v1016063C2 [Oldenlandia corymbosa var. corymbosa]
MDCYRFYHLLLVATMLLVLVAISIVDAQDYPPRFLEVDPKDSEIIENGKFAIDAHNVKENENLEYRSVLRAEKQTWHRLKFNLLINTTGNALYQTFVLTGLGKETKDKELGSFWNVDDPRHFISWIDE